MKLSKLMPEDAIVSAYLTGQLSMLQGRRTGATTGECLELIGRAMQNPTQKVKVQRDFGREGWHQNKYKMHMIQDLIETLGLRHFSVCVISQEIVYNPYGELQVEVNVKWKEE